MKDFFVSYNKADRAWAEWIAWQLEKAGYTTILQAWDFGAGANFPLEMDRAAAESRHTVVVLSPDYLSSRYGQSEWAVAFAEDPKSSKRKLLPVRVAECRLPALLSTLSCIDLVGKNARSAHETLVTEIAGALVVADGRRMKPASPPVFPGEHAGPEFPQATSDERVSRPPTDSKKFRITEVKLGWNWAQFRLSYLHTSCVIEYRNRGTAELVTMDGTVVAKTGDSTTVVEYFEFSAILDSTTFVCRLTPIYSVIGKFFTARVSQVLVEMDGRHIATLSRERSSFANVTPQSS